MKQKEILVFGATGQIGRNLIRKLSINNYKITAVTRNIHRAGYILKTQANPGYINLVEIKSFYDEKIDELMKNSSICINLVGILFESFISDIRFSEYPRYPEVEDTSNNFYKFSKTWAKKKKVLYDKAWNLKTQDQFIELRDLAKKPFSNELLKMQDIDKVEEKLTSIWTKT